MKFTDLGRFGLLLAVLVSPALSAVVTYNWEITYVNTNPDGLFERRVIGVNNAYPIPPINATYNDTLVVNVHNSLDMPTSLHAHGIFQNGTNYMDGPVMVTQCGIPPNQSFTYSFVLQQSGTYWIHAHTMGQYVDGLRAPLIIHDTSEPYTYDEEYIVTVTDWYHDEHKVNKAAYLNTANPSGAEPVPQSGLINNNPSNSTLSFVPGKVYRLRVINMSAFSMFHFSIDGHNMDIIEVDGVIVNRTTVSMFQITAAQRYSILVRALNTTSQNFLIHANMETAMFDQIPPNLNPNITATIVYSPNAPLFTSNASDAVDMFDDTILVPVEPVSTAPADVHLLLNVSFAVFNDGINYGSFNGAPYVFPQVPTLLTALSMGSDNLQPVVYGNVNPFIVEHMQMVEIAINNFDEGMHPFHLHGHQFQVLGRSDAGPYNYSNPFPEQSNPLRRDTLLIPANGHAVIRFRADNPGVWLFHCHIEWHLEAGLMATFIEAPTELAARLTPPSTLLSQCSALGISTTGNAAGNKGTDLTGLAAAPQPLVDGITSKGIGALAATVLAALLGIATVIWYSWDG